MENILFRETSYFFFETVLNFTAFPFQFKLHTTAKVLFVNMY